jgi:hypothetical protein
MTRRAFLLLALLGLGLSGTAYLIHLISSSLDDHRHREIVEAARAQGAADASRDIRSGRLVLRRFCGTEALVHAWAGRGVECPYSPVGFLQGDIVLVPMSEALIARRDAYDAVMQRHIRVRFGPQVFQQMRDESDSRRPAPQ